MGRIVDFTGKVFGKLTVLERLPSEHKQKGYYITFYNCQNDTIK